MLSGLSEPMLVLLPELSSVLLSADAGAAVETFVGKVVWVDSRSVAWEGRWSVTSRSVTLVGHGLVGNAPRVFMFGWGEWSLRSASVALEAVWSEWRR